MGGNGSGSWYRWNSKATTESRRGIDIRYLKDHGLLSPGSAGNLSWTRNGTQAGFINFRVEKNRLVLSYRCQCRDSEWEDVEEVVNFDRTPCHFGGYRKWFLCPGCGRRVVAIYAAGKYFLCKHCYNLTYVTQRESITDRLTRKERKIRMRLGGSGNLLEPFPWKPKGMHWATYERLRSKAEQANFLYRLIFTRIWKREHEGLSLYE
jgi:hypothetical protein